MGAPLVGGHVTESESIRIALLVINNPDLLNSNDQREKGEELD